MSKERGKKFNSLRESELNSSCVTPLWCWLSLQWLIGDRDSHCGVVCARTQAKPVCGSDGRSYESTCELQRARCKDKSLTLAHRGRCRGEAPTASKSKKEIKNETKCHLFPPHLSGRSLGKSEQLPAAPVSTLASEPRDLEVKGKNYETPQFYTYGNMRR